MQGDHSSCSAVGSWGQRLNPPPSVHPSAAPSPRCRGAMAEEAGGDRSPAPGRAEGGGSAAAPALIASPNSINNDDKKCTLPPSFYIGTADSLRDAGSSSSCHLSEWKTFFGGGGGGKDVTSIISLFQ